MLESHIAEKARHSSSRPRRLLGTIGAPSLVGQSSEQHLKRLRKGEVRSLETSSYHLDIIGDLQRVNSLLASVAYAVIGTSEERKAVASLGKG